MKNFGQNSVSVYLRTFDKRARLCTLPNYINKEEFSNLIQRRIKYQRQSIIVFYNGRLIINNFQQEYLSKLNQYIRLQDKQVLHILSMSNITKPQINLNFKQIIKLKQTKKIQPFKICTKIKTKINDFLQNQFKQLVYQVGQKYLQDQKEVKMAQIIELIGYPVLIYTGRILKYDKSFQEQFVQDQSEIMCLFKNQLEEKKLFPINQEQILKQKGISHIGFNQQQIIQVKSVQLNLQNQNQGSSKQCFSQQISKLQSQSEHPFSPASTQLQKVRYKDQQTQEHSNQLDQLKVQDEKQNQKHQNQDSKHYSQHDSKYQNQPQFDDSKHQNSQLHDPKDFQLRNSKTFKLHNLKDSQLQDFKIQQQIQYLKRGQNIQNKQNPAKDQISVNNAQLKQEFIQQLLIQKNNQKTSQQFQSNKQSLQIYKDQYFKQQNEENGAELKQQKYLQQIPQNIQSANNQSLNQQNNEQLQNNNKQALIGDVELNKQQDNLKQQFQMQNMSSSFQKKTTQIQIQTMSSQKFKQLKNQKHYSQPYKFDPNQSNNKRYIQQLQIEQNFKQKKSANFSQQLEQYQNEIKTESEWSEQQQQQQRIVPQIKFVQGDLLYTAQIDVKPKLALIDQLAYEYHDLLCRNLEQFVQEFGNICIQNYQPNRQIFK